MKQEATNGNMIAIQNEISRLRALIEKREKWLNDPANRMRSTWLAVQRDTMQMIDELEELENQLIQLSNH